jgi:cellulose synthase/poly-beta-1,6-N-acetylglucosamine synthase-like glycosyltransferase
MIVLFWVGVGWLTYVYVGYPVALALLALFRRIRPRVDATTLPTVSVLISARNEEKDIGWKVRQTLDWDYPAARLDVLVASDASTDDTDRILERLANPRLTFIRLEPRRGKSAALDELARHARGELLFFSDANSSIAPHALRAMVRHFADPRVGCVTGEMDERAERADSAIGDGARAYWGYEGLLKRLESGLGSVLVCVGSIFCIRRSLYRPLDPDVANDLEIPLRLARAGHWIRYEPTARSVEVAAGSPQEEFSRRRRICAQGLLGMWRLRATLGGLRGWQFVSRKFLRWLVLIPFALVFVASVALAGDPWLLALAGLQAAFYGLAAAGWIRARPGRPVPRLMSVPFYIVLVAVAGLVGMLDTCSGRRFHVWEAAALSRGRSASRP